ncbi:MAG: hypothetical protein L0332_11130 [Chloroflexi bacterium]|nr:hypothetical protein [Chloroflexota bacterium]MCI0727260.1 hypothetical protein [Chloroflexota bacterium]
MPKPKPFRWWLMLVFIAGLVATTALAVAAPAPLTRLFAGDTGVGYDPLTATELERVRQEALADPAVAGQLAGVARYEVLLIERHQEEKSVYESGRWERRADVYIYNYDADTLLQAIYNLDTGAIDNVAADQGVQLPLTEQEVAQAVAIVFNDPELRAILNEAYNRITGETLASPEQVQIKAFVFHASSLPETELGAAATCGLHRCAQLLIFTGDNFAFEFLPVVNLSQQSIALVPFGVSNHEQ